MRGLFGVDQRLAMPGDPVRKSAGLTHDLRHACARASLQIAESLHKPLGPDREVLDYLGPLSLLSAKAANSPLMGRRSVCRAQCNQKSAIAPLQLPHQPVTGVFVY